MLIRFIVYLLLFLFLCWFLIGFLKHEAKENEVRKKKWIYVHLETGNRYIVRKSTYTGIKLKNPTTREWSDAVIYESWADRKKYVRDKEDFRKHFKNLYDIEHNPELEQYRHYLNDTRHEDSYFSIFRNGTSQEN